jgi:hypothetical protein
VERWRDGKSERWKGGKVERWRDGKMERWKDGFNVKIVEFVPTADCQLPT